MDTYPRARPAHLTLAVLGSSAPRLVSWLLLGSLVLGNMVNAWGAEPDVVLILRSNLAPDHAVQQAQAEVRSDPTGFMARAGGVILDSELLNQRQVVAQRIAPTDASRSPMARRFALEFFPDVYVEVELTSEAYPDPNTLVLQGRLPTVELATFSLTYTPESYLITFRDPHSSMLYRVVGDGQTGAGQVTEYDMSKRPPVYEAPPLIPPVQ